MTTARIITALTAAETTTTLPVDSVSDETARRSLFGDGLYQTGSVSGTTSGPVAVQTPLSVRNVFTQGMPDKFDGKGFKTCDTTQITLRSVTLIKRGSDVVLRDRIHKELGNN